jgi:hypothetical protein
MMDGHDVILRCLLRKAEALVDGGTDVNMVRVGWDSKSGEAVDLASAHLSLEEWQSPRQTEHYVPHRVSLHNPFFLSGLPAWEKLGLVSVTNNVNEPMLGRMVLYMMSSVGRVTDNRALQYAHRVAREGNLPLLVVAFAHSGNVETRSAEVRLECLADVSGALAELGIPCLCFACPFCPELIASFGRECATHVVVCDWHPGEELQHQQLCSAVKCPVVCFDSSFWTLRHPSVTVGTVSEVCLEVMGMMMAQMPVLSALSPVVQEMLLEQSSRRVFVPASIVRPLVALPVLVSAGSRAARAETARCMTFLTLCPSSQLVVGELKECVGAWKLVGHVETGAISAAECLRQLPLGLDAKQKRLVTQVLVWSREQRILSSLQVVRASQAELASPTAMREDEPSSDLFCNCIHQVLMKCGAVHPLLLPYWLDGLPSPRIAAAKRLLSQFGMTGWSYSVSANVLCELSLGEPRPLEQTKKMNIIRLLSYVGLTKF